MDDRQYLDFIRINAISQHERKTTNRQLSRSCDPSRSANQWILRKRFCRLAND